MTWRERERRKWGFLVRQRPGLKEADTLTSIINMVLGFSFNSACTISLSLSSLYLATRSSVALLGFESLLSVRDKGIFSSPWGVAVAPFISYLYAPKPKLIYLLFTKARTQKHAIKVHYPSLAHSRQKQIWKCFHTCLTSKSEQMILFNGINCWKFSHTAHQVRFSLTLNLKATQGTSNCVSTLSESPL